MSVRQLFPRISARRHMECAKMLEYGVDLYACLDLSNSVGEICGDAGAFLTLANHWHNYNFSYFSLSLPPSLDLNHHLVSVLKGTDGP